MNAITVAQATKILGNNNDQQTYRQVREGYIPAGVAFWIGKGLRFNEDALKQWMAKGGTPIGGQSKPTEASATAA